MQCPKCGAEMIEIECNNAVIDRCRVCQGIWFDNGAAEQLSHRWVAEYVDIGDPELGDIYDGIDSISCPRCGALMGRFVELEHNFIQYEQCDEHGKFFDAGEFTRWAENRYL